MKSHSIVSAVLAGAVSASLLAAPAVAYEKRPKWGDNEKVWNDYRHEKVREEQVRATRRAGGPAKAIFHPLASSWNKVVR